MTRLLFVGLDVHARRISVAVAEEGARGEVRSLGEIANSEDAIAKLMKRVGEKERLRVCYEAGPTGYALYWQLSKMGIECQVIAPSLIPKKPGDRVKTNRLDAMKLAQCHRSGDLTEVWVPDREWEALRDLVRARQVAKQDQMRARNRVSKMLLRQGKRPGEKMGAWTQKYMKWLAGISFPFAAQQVAFRDYEAEVQHAAERLKRLDEAIDEAVKKAPAEMREVIEALQAMRGIAQITAVTVVAEVGKLSRFQRAPELMGYSGGVPSEASTGDHSHRGPITKTGNAHLRRVVVEAAWAYLHRPSIGRELHKRQEKLPEKYAAQVKEIAWKAQHRLHKRYYKLTGSGKCPQKAVTAIGRELLGFIWAIGTLVEGQQQEAQDSRNASRQGGGKDGAEGAPWKKRGLFPLSHRPAAAAGS
jgi:transposase